jgi:phosphoribosyl 1,2-cyclic phosphodiesterase
MQLICLGSSSKGNSYILTKPDFALILECGVPFREVKKALGFSIYHIEACFLTHSHGDHNKFVGEYLKAGIKVYAHPETILESKIVSYNWRPILPGVELQGLGGFKVIPFEVVHDVKCLGYYFRFHDGNTFCFVTDTHYCPNTFSGLTNVIIECNYSKAMLEKRVENGTIPKFLHDRVVKSHMSLETCKKFLMANDLKAVNNIVLIHLSDGNSNAEEFKKEIENLTGKRVYIADKDMNVNFDKTEF